MPVNPNDYALVVGINDYPSFRPLKGAIGDAKEVQTWLTDSAIGGGVPAAQCGAVFSAPNPVRPIQDDIDEELDRIVSLAEANGGARRFYLYLSGHGVGFESDAAVCLAKWSEKFRTRALETPTYTQYLKDKGLFTEVILMMDCCRVKKVNFKGLPCTLGPITPAPGAGASRQLTAFATEALQPAYEAVVAAKTGADGVEVRGHFTRALLEALYGACSQPAGGVTVTELKKYLEVETPIIAKDAGHEQKPEVVNGLPSVPEPVFGSAPLITSVRVDFQFKAHAGDVALEAPGAAVPVVKQGPASSAAAWTGITLTPGLYSLRDVVSGQTKLFRARAIRKVANVAF
jgi:hypothetical protein